MPSATPSPFARAAVCVDDAQNMFNEYVSFLERAPDIKIDQLKSEMSLNEQVLDRMWKAIETGYGLLEKEGLRSRVIEDAIAQVNRTRRSGVVLEFGGLAKLGAAQVGLNLEPGVHRTPHQLEAPSREAIVALRDLLPREHRRPPHEAGAYTFQAQRGLFDGEAGRAKLFGLLGLVAIVGAVLLGGTLGGVLVLVTPVLLFQAVKAAWRHGQFKKRRRERLHWPVPGRPGSPA